MLLAGEYIVHATHCSRLADTCAYFVIVALIGVFGSLKVKGTQGYFLGERRFSPWVMIGQSLSVGTHPEMIVAVSGAVYATGASAIWYQWKNLFATPFYWIMAPVFGESGGPQRPN